MPAGEVQQRVDIPLGYRGLDPIIKFREYLVQREAGPVHILGNTLCVATTDLMIYQLFQFLGNIAEPQVSVLGGDLV